MRRAILCAAAIAIAMPGVALAGRAADGFTFRKAEFTHSDFTVHVVTHPSPHDLRRSMPDYVRRDLQDISTDVMAWGELTGPNHDICTIHVLPQDKHYAPEWIGHEVVHCIHGRWHY